jgi:hypothetical protein
MDFKLPTAIDCTNAPKLVVPPLEKKTSTAKGVAPLASGPPGLKATLDALQDMSTAGPDGGMDKDGMKKLLKDLTDKAIEEIDKS